MQPQSIYAQDTSSSMDVKLKTMPRMLGEID
jgi:hypothetical protein